MKVAVAFWLISAGFLIPLKWRDAEMLGILLIILGMITLL